MCSAYTLDQGLLLEGLAFRLLPELRCSHSRLELFQYEIS